MTCSDLVDGSDLVFGTLDNGNTLDVISGSTLNAGSLVNSGTLNIEAASSFIVSGVENDGSFNVNSGGELDCSSGFTNGSGTLTLASGVGVDFNGSDLDNAGTIIAGDDISFDGVDALGNAGQIYLGANDQLYAGATLENEGTLSLGSNSSVDVEMYGQLDNQGTLNLTDGAALTVNGGTVDNTGGNIDLTNTTFTMNGDTIGGTLSADNDSTVINTGTLNLSTAINSGNLVLASGATLDNQGTLETDANVSLPDVNLENEGMLNVNTGTLGLSGWMGEDGGTATIASGAQLNLDDGATLGEYDLGTVTNDGTLYLLGGEVTISNLTAVGTLTVDQDATLLVPAEAPSNLSVENNDGGAALSWTSNSVIDDGFVVYDSTDDGTTWNQFDFTDETSCSTGNLDADASYLFRVTAQGSTGETSPTSTVGTVSPAAPTDLGAAYGSGGTGVTLVWTNNSTLANVSFIVQRQNTGGQWETVGTTTETTYIDTSVSGTYAGVYRVVSAVTNDGTTTGTVLGSSSSDAVAPQPLQVPDGSAVYYTTADTGTGTTVPMQQVPGQLGFAYGGGGSVDPAPLAIFQLGTVTDSTSPFDGWPIVQTQPIEYPATQSMTFTVEFPAHYGVSFGVTASASEPGVTFTLTGPGGTALPSNGSVYWYQTLTLSDHANTSSTETYTLSVSGGDSSATWNIFSAGASVYHTHFVMGSIATACVGQTVYEPVTVSDAWGNSVAGDSLNVSGWNSSVLNAMVSQVTTDASGTALVPVNGVQAGASSPLILADMLGGVGATTVPVANLHVGLTHLTNDDQFPTKGGNWSSVKNIFLNGANQAQFVARDDPNTWKLFFLDIPVYIYLWSDSGPNAVSGLRLRQDVVAQSYKFPGQAEPLPYKSVPGDFSSQKGGANYFGTSLYDMIVRNWGWGYVKKHPLTIEKGPQSVPSAVFWEAHDYVEEDPSIGIYWGIEAVANFSKPGANTDATVSFQIIGPQATPLKAP